MTKRRVFLKGSLAALVALGIDPDLLFGATSAPDQSTSTSPAAPTSGLAWFEARRGTSFRIRNGGSWTRVELVDVQPIDIAPELEQFHVTMRGAANAGIREGLHAVLPERGAPTALYLCPTDGGDLTATFSLLRPGAGNRSVAA